jgi:hypothetical protein
LKRAFAVVLSFVSMLMLLNASSLLGPPSDRAEWYIITSIGLVLIPQALLVVVATAGKDNEN